MVASEDAPNSIHISDKERKKLGISWNVRCGILFERNKFRFIINVDREKDFITYEPPRFEKSLIFFTGEVYII